MRESWGGPVQILGGGLKYGYQCDLCLIGIGSNLRLAGSSIHSSTLKSLTGCTNFEQLTAGLEEQAFPPKGGLYVPEATVHKIPRGNDAHALTKEFQFQLPIIYAMVPRTGGHEESQARDMILNVLRKCESMGHTELVITSCFSAFWKRPKTAAGIFKELLSGEMAGVFQRVIFCLPMGTASEKVQLAFESEFSVAVSGEMSTIPPEGLYHLACPGTYMDSHDGRVEDLGRWRVLKVTETTFSLMSLTDGKFLCSRKYEEKCRVALCDFNEACRTSAHWRVARFFDNQYCFRNVQTGRILEGPRTSGDYWRFVAGMDCSETCNWTLSPAESSGPPANVATMLSPEHMPELSLTVEDGYHNVICLGSREGADAEDATWKYCPDGRLESLAYPGKYLSAVSSKAHRVHLWDKVTNHNQGDQIWEFGPDGSLYLASRPWEPLGERAGKACLGSGAQRWAWRSV